MKFLKAMMVLMVASLLIIAGCSQESKQPKIKTIDDVNVETLKEYSGTYVGDNSKVQHLLQDLAGGETIKELELTGGKINVTYGYSGDSLTEKEFNKYWFKGENVDKKNFYFNAIYLTILVPNAKGYQFKVEDSKSTITVSREKMVSVLSKQLTNFPKGENIKDQQELSKFLDKNKGKIKELASKHYQLFD